MLSVTRLRFLREVAYRGSFSAAAEALSYTQSAVSQQIATLEGEAGMALLERHPRGVSLTAAGQTLVGHAEGILARLEAADAALAAIAGLRGGRLRMASFPTAGATLMPLAIATFRSSYPDVELMLAEGEPEEIAPRLRAGELDLALLFEFAGETFLEQDMTRLELLEDPMFLALPRDHRLAGRDALRLGDLAEEPWVQTSRTSPCARHVVRSAHAAGFEPKVSFESDDYQTVQGLVAAGVGVALIPELALSVVREDIVIRALSPTPPVRQVIAAAPAGARLVPAATTMLGVLERAAARLKSPGLPAA
ncbi:MAG: LysR family transcriptional regulator [Solirubrobacterales bacterium]|jgi:DNA-binding transcriptional LysR family regulator|nr:LysR family transcriptional regulator [Solirubrobacterales bacterium]MCW3026150.1 LysR family transcriptional regulator [Solirubrobacterales bacterium]